MFARRPDLGSLIQASNCRLVNHSTHNHLHWDHKPKFLEILGQTDRVTNMMPVPNLSGSPAPHACTTHAYIACHLEPFPTAAYKLPAIEFV